MEVTTVKVEKETLDRLRIYCKENGLILTWYISRAIEEKIERDKK